MVEQIAVNDKVAGSSPARGAKLDKELTAQESLSWVFVLWYDVLKGY